MREKLALQRVSNPRRTIYTAPIPNGVGVVLNLGDIFSDPAQVVTPHDLDIVFKAALEFSVKKRKDKLRAQYLDEAIQFSREAKEYIRQ